MGGNLPSHVPSDSVVGHRTPSHISSEGGVVVAENHIWSKGGVVWAGNPTVSHFEQGRSGRNLKNNMGRVSPPRRSRD